MPNRKIRYKPFVSQLLQVYKTGFNYQSVLSCLPVECAQVFQSEVAKATVNRAVKRNRLLLPELGLDPQGTSSAIPALGKQEPSPFLLILSISMG